MHRILGVLAVLLFWVLFPVVVLFGVLALTSAIFVATSGVIYDYVVEYFSAGKKNEVQN